MLSPVYPSVAVLAHREELALSGDHDPFPLFAREPVEVRKLADVVHLDGANGTAEATFPGQQVVDHLGSIPSRCKPGDLELEIIIASPDSLGVSRKRNAAERRYQRVFVLAFPGDPEHLQLSYRIN